MRLAIIGSRGCKKEIFEKEVAEHLTPMLEDYFPLQPDGTRKGAIVSGGARGVDSFARGYAQKHHIPIEEYLPEYGKYPSRQAPIMRNKTIVEQSDRVLALWDGKSHGTKFTIDYARQQGKPCDIVMI